MEFAKAVCNKLIDRGHWADYIDPCSGLPVIRNIAGFVLCMQHCQNCYLVDLSQQMMHREFTVPYGEVDGFSTLLGYKTANAAGCKVSLLHQWASGGSTTKQVFHVGITCSSKV